MWPLKPAAVIRFSTLGLPVFASLTGGNHETRCRTLAELEKQGRVVRENGVIASPEASAGQDNSPDDEFSRR